MKQELEACGCLIRTKRTAEDSAGVIISEVFHQYAPNASDLAKQMAAAPELLEVARGILVEDMLQYLPAEYVAKVRGAIAKATGAA